jgi:endoglucanase
MADSRQQEAAFRLGRGTNISHWLSQSSRRGEERRAVLTREDIARIADWGFDHIRLPIDEEQMWDESGRPETEAFDLLDTGLDWAAEAGLNVVLDLHVLRSHSFDQQTEPTLFTNPEELEKFVGLWQHLSGHLKCKSPQKLAYELLNEAVATNPEDWNRVALSTHQAIRALEPERPIVLGSNRMNSVLTFDQLRVPHDPNTILTFHFYHPQLITHHQASWFVEGGHYDGPIQYPGTPIPASDTFRVTKPLLNHLADFNQPYDRQAMVADLAKPLAVAARTGLPLYCGEFGVYQVVPMAIREAWYRDILSVFDEFGIAWANWDYRGCFGILDHNRNSTGVAEILLCGNRGGNPGFKTAGQQY